MSREDWLVPIDDGLRGWPHRCTLCGEQQGTKGWWDIMHTPSLAVAVMLCTRCRQRDPEREALRALLERRYAVMLRNAKVEPEYGMIACAEQSQGQAAGPGEAASSRAVL